MGSCGKPPMNTFSVLPWKKISSRIREVHLHFGTAHDSKKESSIVTCGETKFLRKMQAGLHLPGTLVSRDRDL